MFFFRNLLNEYTRARVRSHTFTWRRGVFRIVFIHKTESNEPSTQKCDLANNANNCITLVVLTCLSVTAIMRSRSKNQLRLRIQKH